MCSILIIVALLSKFYKCKHVNFIIMCFCNTKQPTHKVEKQTSKHLWTSISTYSPKTKILQNINSIRYHNAKKLLCLVLFHII